MKLCTKYGNSRLENACERLLSFSSSPSIRNISTLLKNYSGALMKGSSDSSGEKYAITRGAAYWGKDGDEK
jgi:hypothetical protein